MMHLHETILLTDVDGVLANWDKAAIEAAEVPITEDQISSWEWYAPYMSTTEFWKRIDSHKYFWEDIEPYPYAHDLVDALKSYGQVVFATSPSLNPESAAEKISWLRKHGFLSPKGMNYAIGPHKWLMANPNHVLIDDSRDQVNLFIRRGGNAILFPSSTNRFVFRDVPIDNKIKYVCNHLANLRHDSLSWFHVPLEKSQ